MAIQTGKASWQGRCCVVHDANSIPANLRKKPRSIDPVYATLEKGDEFGAIDPVNAEA